MINAQQVITKDGFTLKPLAVEDRQLYVRLYTDPDVMKWIGPPVTEQRANFLFQQALTSEKCSTYYYWVVFNAAGDKAGLTAFIMQSQTVAEFGLMLLPEFCFKGYSVPVLSGLINFGFGHWQLTQVVARHQSNNLAAPALLKRLRVQKVSDDADYWFWQLEQSQWAELNTQPPYLKSE